MTRRYLQRCRHCGLLCRGACPGARAAYEQAAALQRAALETRPETPVVRTALDALTERDRTDLFR